MLLGAINLIINYNSSGEKDYHGEKNSCIKREMYPDKGFISTIFSDIAI